MMEKLFFQNKVLFTGQDKDLEGYYYNGIYWKNIGINNAEICKSYFQQLYNHYTIEFNKCKSSFEEAEQKAILATIKTLDNAKRRNDVIKILKQEFFVDKVEWNKNPNIFVFEDCIYDLSKGEFIKPEPEQYINMTCGYELGIKNGIIPSFEEESKCIDKFILSIMDTEAKKLYILKVLSTFLKQKNTLEKCFFWLGKGRNGKGTGSIFICSANTSCEEYCICDAASSTTLDHLANS